MFLRNRLIKLIIYGVLIVGIACFAGAGRVLENIISPLQIHTQVDFPTYVTGVAWSPDSEKIAVYSGYGKEITILGVDGKELGEMTRPLSGPWYGNSIDFVSADSLLTPPYQDSAPYKGDALAVWDTSRGSVSGRIAGPSPGGSFGSNWASSFAVSEDKGTVAILTNGGNTVAAYSTKTGAQIDVIPIPPTDSAISIAVSTDGGLIAIGTTMGNISVFDKKTGKSIRMIAAFPNVGMGVCSLAFSPDGMQIAAGSYGDDTRPDNDAPVRVWKLADGALAYIFHHAKLYPIRGIEWDPRGDRIAFVASDNEVRVWNPKTNDMASYRMKGRSMSLAFSPDGKYLAVPYGNTLALLTF